MVVPDLDVMRDHGIVNLNVPVDRDNVKATLKDGLRKTAYAISTDETRYILNGLYFEPGDQGKVRVVATDGHRLSLVERELEGDFKLKKGVILPRKGLLELRRLIEEAPDAECFLGFGDTTAENLP